MEDDEDFGHQFAVFDANAVSVLQSVFNCSGAPQMEEGFSKTVSVKFMLTMQDEEDLRDLGYSQSQIDKIKPQEAESIIQSGTQKAVQDLE